jgi:hypothetical protein
MTRATTTTRTTTVASLLLAFALAGCLPIELSVSPGGKILIPRQEGFVAFDPAKGTAAVAPVAEGDSAAFALYSPDGKSMLCISKTTGGGMGTAFNVKVLAGEAEPKGLLGATNLTYARWSPDGKSVTLTRLADAAAAPLKDQLPELILINLADGAKKTIASNVSIIHRWFPDSKAILTFHISAKEDKGDRYSGSLVRLNVETGKAEPLAAVLGPKQVFFDLSPDGKKAVFTAIQAGKPGAAATSKPAADAEARLYELDIATGEVRPAAARAVYALYSPKGTKVLVGVEGGSAGVQLQVGKADLTDLHPIAEGVVKSVGEPTSSAEVYPTWLDDDTVLYLALHNVYGIAGKNLSLMSVAADGKNPRDLQPKLDAALVK